MLALALTLFFAVTLSFTIYISDQKDNTIYAEEADVTISTWEELQSFASAVNSGNTYSGKLVQLTNNIDCGGTDLSCIGSYSNPAGNSDFKNYFDGTFDGQGYTVTNFRLIDGYKYFIPLDRVPTEWRIMGFFAVVGSNARIMNLHLDSFNVYANLPVGDREAWCGGLIGASRSRITERGTANHKTNPTIDSCQVTNFSSTINRRDNVAGVLGLGSANVNNCFVDGLTNCDYSFGPVSSSVTIRPKTALIGDYSLKVESDNVSVKNCITKSSLSLSYDSGKTSNCKTTANDVSGLNWSATGGKDVSQPWYYCSEYNNGYPYLRIFMQWYQYPIFIWGQGSITIDGNEPPLIESGFNEGMPSIYLPKDYINSVGWPSLSGSTNPGYALGQQIEAIPDENWEFKRWWNADIYNQRYICEFIQPEYDIIFKKPLNEIGNEVDDIEIKMDGEIVSEPQTFTVLKGTNLTVSHQNGTGALTLKYTFKDRIGTEHEFVYEITEKYRLTSAGIDGAITADTTISPTVEVRTFSVTFKTATGSTLTGADKPWTVEYGSTITYNNSSTITFTQGSNTATYTPIINYKFATLTIKKDDKASNTDALKSVTGNLEIEPTFELWRTVTFKEISNTSSPTNNQTMLVRNGENINVSLSSDKKTLTYKYNNSSVTYTANQYYILADQSNRTSITISTDGVEITPIATFYACQVTMTNTSQDSEDDNKAMATMSGYSSAFIVEFGTILAATHSTNSSGNEVYTYSFTYNGSTVKTVTYTTTATKYEINSYGIEGTATSHTFAAGTTSKTISPTFKVKQYTLTITEKKGGTDTQTERTIYHSDTLTYSANLSLSNASKFAYSTTSLYEAIANTEHKYTGYFVESYTITYGTTTSVVSADGTETTDTNVSVTSNIGIEIEFKTFYSVTFTTGQTGVASATAQNSYTNPMNLKSGSRIQATYSGYPSRDLTYSVTYTDGSSVTEQVFKYTLSQYYRVTDTKDIDNLQATTTISPTIEFYACEVTIWKDDANNIATLKVDGVEKTSSYIFIVEYGTEVEFATPTQSEGKFTYTYIFTYAGEEIARIVYTITDDEYAMSSELTTEGRVWHSDLGEKDKAEEYEFKSTAGIKYTISPTFEFKEYGGNVA